MIDTSVVKELNKSKRREIDLNFYSVIPGTVIRL